MSRRLPSPGSPSRAGRGPPLAWGSWPVDSFSGGSYTLSQQLGHCPTNCTAALLSALAQPTRLGTGTSALGRHDTLPQSLHTKWGCSRLSSRLASSKRVSPPARVAIRTSPASVSATRLRYTVALSQSASSPSRSKHSPWESGRSVSARTRSTATRGAVTRNPSCRRPRFVASTSHDTQRWYHGARGVANPRAALRRSIAIVLHQRSVAGRSALRNCRCCDGRASR